MEKPSTAQFIEALAADDALRQKVAEAERAAARDVRSHTDAITQIAREEGYDISGWLGRPMADPGPEESDSIFDCCISTCCWVETSVAAVK